MKKTLPSPLTSRLESHFLTCSAVVAGVTSFTAAHSQGAVVYSGIVNAPIYPLNDPGNGGLFNGGLYFDFELPGTITQGTRFPTWDVNPYESGTKWYIAANTHMVTSGGNGGTAVNLLGGTSIGPASVYNTDGGAAVVAVVPPVSGGTYLGFKFTSNNPEGNVGTVPLYGWALVNYTTGAPATLVSYAYETSGAAITAGAVPEPSSLSMLALGAFGLTQLRRRRAA